jgi:hypothetical protein
LKAVSVVTNRSSQCSLGGGASRSGASGAPRRRRQKHVHAAKKREALKEYQVSKVRPQADFDGLPNETA